MFFVTATGIRLQCKITRSRQSRPGGLTTIGSAPGIKSSRECFKGFQGIRTLVKY